MKDLVLITDDRGRKFLARLSGEMVTIAGLGAFSADAIKDALSLGELVVGGKVLSIRNANIDDVLSIIERKTQTLTAKDIGLMIHLCDVRPGSRIVEGGAGSGALTISLLASVGTDGEVTTYELREENAATARKNIAMTSLGDKWSVKIRDICKGIDERNSDAVILDIPTPWECAKAALDALKIGGTFCAFIPNANQAESTVNALRENHFMDVKVTETIMREMVVHDGGIRPSFDMLGHTGYLVFARRRK